MASGCPSPPPAAVRDLAAAARRLVALRDKAGPLTAVTPPEPRTLADAIDRDFLLFDLEQAVADLRAALAALDPGAPPAG